MASISFDDLPAAKADKPALSFDDLPMAGHGLSFDDLPMATTPSDGGATAQSKPASRSVSPVVEAPPSELASNPGTQLEIPPKPDWSLDEEVPEDAGLIGLATNTFGAGGLIDSLLKNSPLSTVPEPTGDSRLAGATRAIEHAAKGLVTPENIGIMASLGGAPALAHKAAAATFGLLAGKAVPEQIKAGLDAKSPGERSEAWTGAGINTIFAALGAVGALKGESAPPLSKEASAAIIAKAPTEVLSAAVSDPKLAANLHLEARQFIAQELQGRHADELAAAAETAAPVAPASAAVVQETARLIREKAVLAVPPKVDLPPEPQAAPPAPSANEIPTSPKRAQKAPETIHVEDPALDALLGPDEPVSKPSADAVQEAAPVPGTADSGPVAAEPTAEAPKPSATAPTEPPAPAQKTPATSESPASSSAEPTPATESVSNGSSPVVGEADYAGGPGAMGPVEAAAMEEGRTTTATKNAVMEAERKARNADPVIKEARQSNEETFAKAEAAIEANPDHAKSIVEELLDGTKKEVSEVDEATLLYEKTRLRNERNMEAERATDPHTSEGEREEARIRWAQHEAAINDLDHATAASGRIWGRLGQFRQRLLRDDYTFEAMERKARVAKGSALTPEESAKIQEQAQRITELEKQAETRAETVAEAERLKDVDEAFERFKKDTAAAEAGKPRIAPRIFALAESIVTRLDVSANAARARIRARLGQANAGVDPVVIYDVAVIGASKLGHAALDFGKWSAEMVADLGDWVQPHLAEAWHQSNKLLADQEKQLSKVDVDAVKKVRGKKATDADRKTNILTSIKERLKEGDDATDLGPFVRSLAREYVRSGISERDALVDAVHGELTQLIPTITRRETMDAISGYGDFRPLNTEPVEVTLRDLKGQLQQVAKIEDMEGGKAPAKTGVERRTPSDEERRLQKIVNERKKLGGFTVTDPATQLKTALDAIKTRLRNELRDIDHALATREPIANKQSQLTYDAEAAALRAERDVRKAEYDEAFPKKPLTDAQRLERAGRVLDRNIAKMEDDLKHGRLYADKSARQLTSPELDAKRARLDALRSQRDLLRDSDTARIEQEKQDALVKGIAKLRAKFLSGDIETKTGSPTVDTEAVAKLKAERETLQKDIADKRKAANPPKPEEVRRVEQLDKRIAELEAKIAAGDTSTKPGRATVDTKEIAERKALLEKLNEQLSELRKGPTLSPNELALKAYKSRALTRMAEFKDRLSKSDFAPKQRRPLAKDAEALKIETELARAKLEFDRACAQDRLAKRSGTEKALDGVAKWRRAFVLSGVKTLAKLSSAAAEIIAVAPIEEAVGGAISKALPGVASRAPRHGGFSLSAERDAIVGTWTNLFRDIGDEMKHGHMDIDVLYGRPDLVPMEWKDYIAHIHGALKSPARRNEFIRSFEKRTDHAIRNGVDVSDPLVQTALSVEAYKDARAAIFRNDNKVVDAWNSMVRTLSQPEKATGRPSMRGKLGETAAKVLLPVVRIPTNIVARTFEYSLGTASGSARLARVMFQEGLNNVRPEEADAIMRNLKRGSIGAAVMAIGYFNADQIGGYYEPGKKRDSRDVKYGHLRMFGHDVPSYLIHNPLLEQLQVGATIRRVADSKLHRKDREAQGITAGAVAAAIGVIEEAPFLNEMEALAKLKNPSERFDFIGELSKTAVPILVQQVATATDKDKNGETVRRKPQSVIDHLKMAIPGLRKEVPVSRK